jgi:hypothetical protein
LVHFAAHAFTGDSKGQNLDHDTKRHEADKFTTH